MSESFNILYLANSGEIIGGGQISLLGLLEKLDRGNYHPIVVCPEISGLYNELKKNNIETHIIRMETLRNLNIFSWVKTVNKLIKLIKRKKIDLIHSNGSRATIFGGIAAKITKTPLVWHVRIADCDKLLDRLLAGLSTKIIAISKAVKRRFDWLRNHEKVIVIYNGVDLERFNSSTNGKEIRGELRIPSETPIVGIVGRLDWYKGHKYFLQAAKMVTKIIPDVRFIIVGEGEYRNRLENQVKQLNLGKNVIFTGNRNDIPEILACIDLFVLSSVSEGFGRAAAEASACGKPVVATNIGGIPEVIEDGVSGKLVPPKNPIALAESIIDLLKNKEDASKMGIEGRKKVKTLFDIERNVESIRDVYLDVLAGEKCINS